MIAFQSSLQQSKSCLILGDRQGSKLLLAGLLLELAGAHSLQVVSPFNNETTQKKLKEISKAAEHFKNLTLAKVLSATDDYPALKAAHGFQFLLKDFTSIVENCSSDAIYFHRIDEFFSIQDRRFIPDFFRDLTAAAKSKNKFVYFSLFEGIPEQSLFQAEVEQYLDLELIIRREGQVTNDRTLEIKYSSFPIDSRVFKLKASPKTGFELKAYFDDLMGSEEKHYHIALISTADDTLARLNYLLTHHNISVTICSGQMSEVISTLLKKPDLVIYDATDDQVMDLDLYEIAKSNHIKVIEISELNHLRKSDKLTALQKGCFDVFPRDYFVEDVVIAIEQALGFSFYCTEVERPVSDTKLPPAELLEQLVTLHLNHYKQFCMLEFDLEDCDSDLVNSNNIYNPLRSADSVWLDQANKKLYLLVSDMLKHNAVIIEDKVQTSLPGALMVSAREASEFLDIV